VHSGCELESDTVVGVTCGEFLVVRIAGTARGNVCVLQVVQLSYFLFYFVSK
jgi:hypothetical protein